MFLQRITVQRQLLLGEGNKVSLNSSKQFYLSMLVSEECYFMCCSKSWTTTSQRSTESFSPDAVGRNQATPSARTTQGNGKLEEINIFPFTWAAGEAATAPLTEMLRKGLEFKLCSSPDRGETEGQGEGSLVVCEGAGQAQNRALLRVQKKERVVWGQTPALSTSWAHRTWLANRDQAGWVIFFTAT